MNALFRLFPTVEEEVYYLKRHYQLFGIATMLFKLAKAFFITSMVSFVLYFMNGFDANANQIKLFSILCFIVTLGLFLMFALCTVWLARINKKSFQIPEIRKECVNVSVKDLYQLLEDDFSIHEKMKQVISKDEELSVEENNRFDLICDMHFFMWRTLNEYAYEELIAQQPSSEEIEILQEQQEQFQKSLLGLFANSPDMCKKVEQWYQVYEQKVSMCKAEN